MDENHYHIEYLNKHNLKIDRDVTQGPGEETINTDENRIEQLWIQSTVFISRESKRIQVMICYRYEIYSLVANAFLCIMCVEAGWWVELICTSPTQA